jgi:hypothetical protein
MRKETILSIWNNFAAFGLKDWRKTTKNSVRIICNLAKVRTGHRLRQVACPWTVWSHRKSRKTPEPHRNQETEQKTWIREAGLSSGSSFEKSFSEIFDLKEINLRPVKTRGRYDTSSNVLEKTWKLLATEWFSSPSSKQSKHSRNMVPAIWIASAVHADKILLEDRVVLVSLLRQKEGQLSEGRLFSSKYVIRL